MGATSRRKLTLGTSAADRPPATRRNNTGDLLLSMRGTSGYVEWNRAGDHQFLAIVCADTAVDINVVEAGIRCLSCGHGKTAGGHVDHADVFGANDVDANLLGRSSA